jgi:hypothetical protein
MSQASRPYSPPTGFNRSAIMRRAWALARQWHDDARLRHLGAEQMRPRVALRLEAPAPFAGRLRDHLAEALSAAWSEAKAACSATIWMRSPDCRAAAAPAAPKSDELIRAEGALASAYAIESWWMAAPAIRDAEARVNRLRLDA